MVTDSGEQKKSYDRYKSKTQKKNLRISLHKLLILDPGDKATINVQVENIREEKRKKQSFSFLNAGTYK